MLIATACAGATARAKRRSGTPPVTTSAKSLVERRGLPCVVSAGNAPSDVRFASP